MCRQDSWSSRSTLSSQVGTSVSGWLSQGHVIFSLPLPPFLTLFRSVSLFHTFHPTVADTCLRNASDRCLSRSASQLHLGHLFNLRQRDASPPLTSFSVPPSRAAPWLFSSTGSVGLAELLSCCSVVCVLSVSRPSHVFVSPLDSGALIIFAEQRSSAAISTVSFHHHYGATV